MNYELSFWGIALTLVLWLLAVALFLLIDRREMRRVLRVSALMAVQLVAVGGGAWVVYKMHVWWACLLWLVVMLVLATAWCVHEIRGERQASGKTAGHGLLMKGDALAMKGEALAMKGETLAMKGEALAMKGEALAMMREALVVAGGLLAGCAVAGGSLMLTLPGGCFVPVFGVLLAFLSVSVKQTLQTYQRSMLHTEAHRQYLLANGATRLESLMPSVRRALRAAVQPQLKTMAQPLLVAMPLLFAGMLLGGASPVGAVVVVLLLMAATFVASVVAGVAAIYLTHSALNA
ncbi:MAG: ABC transporter permease [Prevotella sp.]|nr:ABC transporter permease [Prevotella sp.]